MLALKLAIAYAIPDVPGWVEVEMAKVEFRRRELEKAAAFAGLGLNSASSMSAGSTPANSRANSLENDDNAGADKEQSTATTTNNGTAVTAATSSVADKDGASRY